MNDKKIQIIINITDEKFFPELRQSLMAVVAPEDFVVEVKPIAWGGASIKLMMP